MRLQGLELVMSIISHERHLLLVSSLSKALRCAIHTIWRRAQCRLDMESCGKGQEAQSNERRNRNRLRRLQFDPGIAVSILERVNKCDTGKHLVSRQSMLSRTRSKDGPEAEGACVCWSKMQLVCGAERWSAKIRRAYAVSRAEGGGVEESEGEGDGEKEKMSGAKTSTGALTTRKTRQATQRTVLSANWSDMMSSGILSSTIYKWLWPWELRRSCVHFGEKLRLGSKPRSNLN